MTFSKLTIKQFFERNFSLVIDIDDEKTITELKQMCFDYICKNRNIGRFAIVSLLSEINLVLNEDIYLNNNKKICDYQANGIFINPIYMIINIDIHKSEE